MFDSIKRKIYNLIKRKQETQANKKALNKKDWVTCEICGYEGSLDDFLVLDENDTKCPKCRQDSQVFEV